MKNIINREMTRVKRTTQWLLLLASIGITPALVAQQNAAVLDHIQSSSTLNVSYHQLPPFSFTDHSGKVTGYTIAVRNMIADKLCQHLKLNNLAVHYTSVNSTERFSALNSREIDMDHGVNTNAPERTASMSFSENYCTAKMRIISLCKNNTWSIPDFKGRTVSPTGSSKDLPGFNKINREQHLNISTITSTIIKGAFEKMAHNESAAFLIDDTLAWSLINHSEQSEPSSVSSGSIGNDMHYAIMMRKSDQQFVTFVDGTLKDFFALPVNVQLRKKWLFLWSCEKLKNPSSGSCQHGH